MTGRFQKISIPIPQTAFRISKVEGGLLWNSEGMGVFTVGNPKGSGDFTAGISGVESVQSSLKTLIEVDFCSL